MRTALDSTNERTAVTGTAVLPRRMIGRSVGMRKQKHTGCGSEISSGQTWSGARQSLNEMPPRWSATGRT